MKKLKMIIPQKKKSFLSNKKLFFNLSTVIASLLLGIAFIVYYIINFEPVVVRETNQFFRFVGMAIVFAIGCLIMFVIALVSKPIFHILKFRCPFCGSINAGDSYFCENCLRKIDINNIYNHASFIECPSCGEFLNIKNIRCTNCGFSFHKYKKIWKKRQ